MHELDVYLEAHDFLRVSGTPGYEHGNALYLRIDPQDTARDQTATDQELQDFTGLRVAMNAIISSVNDGPNRTNMDYTKLDETLLSVFDQYSGLLDHPLSRDVCLTTTRMDYDNQMAGALSAYLKPLGWP